MADLVLRSDLVVTPAGVGAHDIAVSGGRITAVAPHGSLAAPTGGRLIELPLHAPAIAETATDKEKGLVSRERARCGGKNNRGQPQDMPRSEHTPSQYHRLALDPRTGKDGGEAIAGY